MTTLTRDTHRTTSLKRQLRKNSDGNLFRLGTFRGSSPEPTLPSDSHPTRKLHFNVKIKDSVFSQAMADRRKGNYLREVRAAEVESHIDVTERIYLASHSQGDSDQAIQTAFRYIHQKIPGSEYLTSFLSGFIYADAQPFCEEFRRFMRLSSVQIKDSRLLLRDLVRELTDFTKQNELGGIFLDKNVTLKNTMLKMQVFLLERRQLNGQQLQDQVGELERVVRLLKHEKFEMLREILEQKSKIPALKATIRNNLLTEERLVWEKESLLKKLENAVTILKDERATNINLTEKLKETSASNDRLRKELVALSHGHEGMAQELREVNKLLAALADKLAAAKKELRVQPIPKLESLTQFLENQGPNLPTPSKRKGIVSLVPNIPSLRERMPPRDDTFSVLDRNEMRQLCPEQLEDLKLSLFTATEGVRRIPTAEFGLLRNALVFLELKTQAVLAALEGNFTL